MRRQRGGLLFLLPLALGLACLLHTAKATGASSSKHHRTLGFLGCMGSSSRRPAAAAATAPATTTTTAALALQQQGGGHDDDLGSSTSHICHAWCGCARRRQHRRAHATATRLWATKEEEEEAGAFLGVLVMEWWAC